MASSSLGRGHPKSGTHASFIMTQGEFPGSDTTLTEPIHSHALQNRTGLAGQRLHELATNRMSRSAEHRAALVRGQCRSSGRRSSAIRSVGVSRTNRASSCSCVSVTAMDIPTYLIVSTKNASSSACLDVESVPINRTSGCSCAWPPDPPVSNE